MFKIQNKLIFKTCLVLIACVLLVYFAVDIYLFYNKPMTLIMPPPPMMSVEAGTVKVVLSQDTPWMSIAKMLTVVLGTYLGIKLINKYVK